MSKRILIIILIFMLLLVSCDSSADKNETSNQVLENVTSENQTITDEETTEGSSEAYDRFANINKIEELEEIDDSITTVEYYGYYFYGVNGKWYTALTDNEDKSTVKEMKVVPSFVVTVEDLKNIKIDMDVYQLVETVGLFSSSESKGNLTLIFDADDGSYAVVYLRPEFTQNNKWELFVRHVAVRDAEDLKDDLQVGMLTHSIPYDEVDRYSYLDYGFYEHNGRVCAFRHDGGEITKVEYYEFYDVTAEMLALIKTDMTVFEAVKLAGVPKSALVDGETVLLFESEDGNNAAVKLDESGEKIVSVALDVEYLVKERETYSTLVERFGEEGVFDSAGKIIFKWILDDGTVLRVHFDKPYDIDEPKYPDDCYATKFEIK